MRARRPARRGAGHVQRPDLHCLGRELGTHHHHFSPFGRTHMQERRTYREERFQTRVGVRKKLICCFASKPFHLVHFIASMIMNIMMKVGQVLSVAAVLVMAHANALRVFNLASSHGLAAPKPLPMLGIIAIAATTQTFSNNPFVVVAQNTSSNATESPTGAPTSNTTESPTSAPTSAPTGNETATSAPTSAPTNANATGNETTPAPTSNATDSPVSAPVPSEYAAKEAIFLLFGPRFSVCFVILCSHTVPHCIYHNHSLFPLLSADDGFNFLLPLGAILAVITFGGIVALFCIF